MLDSGAATDRRWRDWHLHNILITGPLVTATKIERFVGCLAHDPACAVVVESWDGAQLLHQALSERHLKAAVLLDIDIGQHPTGVAAAGAFDLFRRIGDLPTLQLKGIGAATPRKFARRTTASARNSASTSGGGFALRNFQRRRNRNV